MRSLGYWLLTLVVVALGVALFPRRVDGDDET